VTYVRVAAALVVLALAGWLAHTFSTWREKAGERDAAVAELKQVRTQADANLKAIAQDIAEDRQGRIDFAAAMAHIDSQFAGIVIPTPAQLVQSKEMPGEPCKRDSLGPDFMRVWNSSGAAAGPAEDKAH